MLLINLRLFYVKDGIKDKISTTSRKLNYKINTITNHKHMTLKIFVKKDTYTAKIPYPYQ